MFGCNGQARSTQENVRAAGHLVGKHGGIKVDVNLVSHKNVHNCVEFGVEKMTKFCRRAMSIRVNYCDKLYCARICENYVFSLCRTH